MESGDGYKTICLRNYLLLGLLLGHHTLWLLEVLPV